MYVCVKRANVKVRRLTPTPLPAINVIGSDQASLSLACILYLFFFFAGASYPPVMILHIIHTISMATPYQPCAAHGYKKYREEVDEEKTNDSSDI